MSPWATSRFLQFQRCRPRRHLGFPHPRLVAAGDISLFLNFLLVASGDTSLSPKFFLAAGDISLFVGFPHCRPRRHFAFRQTHVVARGDISVLPHRPRGDISVFPNFLLVTLDFLAPDLSPDSARNVLLLKLTTCRPWRQLAFRRISTVSPLSPLCLQWDSGESAGRTRVTSKGRQHKRDETGSSSLVALCCRAVWLLLSCLVVF